MSFGLSARTTNIQILDFDKNSKFKNQMVKLQNLIVKTPFGQFYLTFFT